MSCRRVRRLLPLHVGGDLEPAEAHLVSQHLEACSGCVAENRAFLDSRAALLEAGPAFGSPEPPRVWASLEARLDAVDAAAHLRRPWYRRTSVLSSAVAAALLIALIPVVGPGFGGASTDGSSDGEGATDGAVADLGTAPAGSLRLVPDEVLDEFMRRGGWVRPAEDLEAPIFGAAASFRFAEY